MNLETGEVIHKDPLPTLQGQEAVILRKAIQDILKPDLVCPDSAFSSQVPTATNKKKLEAQIRRAFLEFFASVLQGYRDYTPLMKLFPTPIIFFQEHAYLHKYAAVGPLFLPSRFVFQVLHFFSFFCLSSPFQRKDFLEHFLPTSMFDNFIREDAASLEQTLFSKALSDFKANSKLTLQLEEIVESYHEIQNPLDRQEADPGSPPSAGKLLELNLFPPIIEIPLPVIPVREGTTSSSAVNVMVTQSNTFSEARAWARHNFSSFLSFRNISSLR